MHGNDCVLVTGISGFLGSHIALKLLQSGYRVRGSVRDLKKAGRVATNIALAGGDVQRLEFCELELLDDRGWLKAADGCQYLLHVASPFTLTMPKDENTLIVPAVEGTRRAIGAAIAANHRRIILTSSVAAMDGGHDDFHKVIDENCWTQVKARHVNAYCKSKTLAERAAWQLTKTEQVSDRLVVINPGTMLGPLLGSDIGASVTVVHRMLSGGMPMVPDLRLPYVDVRDVADAHVSAMTDANAGGKRHIICNDSTSLWDIADLLRDDPIYGRSLKPMRRLKPWLARIVMNFDRSLKDNRAWIGVTRHYDSALGQNLIGRPLRTTTDTVKTTAKFLRDHHVSFAN